MIMVPTTFEAGHVTSTTLVMAGIVEKMIAKYPNH
jgi:hypothetical protein